MLTISRPLSSGQAQRYHAEEFTSRGQSYYAEAENVRGEWQGRLATDLGLQGDGEHEGGSAHEGCPANERKPDSPHKKREYQHTTWTAGFTCVNARARGAGTGHATMRRRRGGPAVDARHGVAVAEPVACRPR